MQKSEKSGKKCAEEKTKSILQKIGFAPATSRKVTLQITCNGPSENLDQFCKKEPFQISVKLTSRATRQHLELQDVQMCINKCINYFEVGTQKEQLMLMIADCNAQATTDNQSAAMIQKNQPEVTPVATTSVDVNTAAQDNQETVPMVVTISCQSELDLEVKKLENQKNQLQQDATKWKNKWLASNKQHKQDLKAEENSAVHWDKDDIMKAISVRALSIKTYQYIRNKLNIPLPGLTTIRRRWAADFKHHIHLQGRDRQRVAEAAKLFSHKTAVALGRYLNDEEASEVFKVINDTFDVFNSSIPVDQKNKVKSGYGNYLKQQNEILENMDQLILNQDCLEHTFSDIRGTGQSDSHPLPAEFKNRLRLLLLGANCGDLSKGRVIEVQDGEPNKLLSSSILSKAIPQTEDTEETDEIDNSSAQSTSIDEFDDIRQLLQEYSNSRTSEPNLHSSEIEQSEQDGLEYISGYIAFRCNDVDNSLGKKISHFCPSSAPSWLKLISSNDGLFEPSENWLQLVKEFEVLFCQLHGTYINKSKGIIKELQNIISKKYPAVHKKIICCYSKLENSSSDIDVHC
uniref:Uncharacterized protein n=1 Tax=Strigamia maritima TaxID=126957 RepID=T1IK01_STRMM